MRKLDMKSRLITVIPDDGIGPSIVKATIKVLDEIGCDFEYEYFDVGITALEKEGLDSQRDSRFN